MIADFNYHFACIYKMRIYNTPGRLVTISVWVSWDFETEHKVFLSPTRVYRPSRYFSIVKTDSESLWIPSVNESDDVGVLVNGIWYHITDVPPGVYVGPDTPVSFREGFFMYY